MWRRTSLGNGHCGSAKSTRNICDAHKITLEARLLEELREQKRLDGAESSRANGRKTMAGPHARSIQSSAGGRAGNATHRSEADQLAFHSAGGKDQGGSAACSHRARARTRRVNAKRGRGAQTPHARDGGTVVACAAYGPWFLRQHASEVAPLVVTPTTGSVACV